MIRGLDLRLDNLLQDAKGRVCRVDGLSVDDNIYEVKAYATSGAITTFPLSGIKITKKLLEHIGFKEDRYDKVLGIQVNETDTWCINKVDDYWELYCTEVKLRYVHELQNLWWLLFKEELKIRL